MVSVGCMMASDVEVRGVIGTRLQIYREIDIVGLRVDILGIGMRCFISRKAMARK